MNRFIIKSRTYGTIEFSCSAPDGTLSRMEVYCQSIGWQLVTACAGGSVSGGVPVFVDRARLPQVARRWWKQAKSRLDQQMCPHVGDLRVDDVQWVHSDARKKHVIVNVSEYSNGEWVYAGKWIAFLMSM